MDFIDYGTIDWFNASKGFGVVKGTYNGDIFIHKNDLKGTPIVGSYVLVGKIRKNVERKRYDGVKVIIWNENLDSLCEEIFEFWLLKQPLKFNADIKWLLERCSENLLDKIINSNKNHWLEEEEFLTFLNASVNFIANNRKNNQRYREIVSEFFFEIWENKGNKKFDKNLSRAIDWGNNLLVKALQIDSNWIEDIEFISKFNSSKFNKNIIYEFLKKQISKNDTNDYNNDIKWIIANGDNSILSFIIGLKFLYSNEQFVSDMRQIKQRYSSVNFSHFLYNQWIFKGEFKFNEDIKWLFYEGPVDIIIKIMKIISSNLIQNNDFLTSIRELKLINHYYDIPKDNSIVSENEKIVSNDKILIIQDYIFEEWNSQETKDLDDNLKWLIQNGKIETLQKIINQDKQKWLNNNEFLITIRELNSCSSRIILDEIGTFTERKTVVSNDKISVIEDLIFTVWNSQEIKDLDENLMWLIRNGKIENLQKIVNQDKQKWLKNKKFIDYIREIRFFDDNNFKENFLFEVCMNNCLFEFNENVKWIFENANINNIKTILTTKFGYKKNIIEKIYLAYYPSNNNNFYIENVDTKNWSENFKMRYIKEQENHIKSEFSKLFINEFESIEKKAGKRKRIRKETHAATDLASFVFCPASYALNQTFDINIQEQENVFIGIQEHEKQRLLSLTDYKKIEDHIYEPEFENYYQDFNRVFNSTCISQGHKDKSSVIYYSKKKKLSGIPDYIFKDVNGYFAVEEKYTFKKYEELNELYLNHRVQALAYLYGLDEFQFDEVLVLYWFIKKDDYGEGYHVSNYRLFNLKKSNENKDMIIDAFNNLESIQHRNPFPFPPNKINYKKCIRCNYFPYCEYKKGDKSNIQLDSLET